MTVAVAMTMAPVPMRMRIRVVIMCLLPDDPGLVRALLVTLVGNTVMRVHVSDEWRGNCPRSLFAAARTDRGLRGRTHRLPVSESAAVVATIIVERHVTLLPYIVLTQSSGAGGLPNNAFEQQVPGQPAGQHSLDPGDVAGHFGDRPPHGQQQEEHEPEHGPGSPAEAEPDVPSGLRRE